MEKSQNQSQFIVQAALVLLQEAAAQAGSLIDVQAAPVVRAGNHPAVKRNLLAAGTASITGIS
ncbi:MAG: hypothetical protein ACLTEE_06385 [Anaerobutyricum hallii]